MDLTRSQKKARAQQRADLQAALEHAPSRRVLRRLLALCGLHEDVFDADPVIAAYKAGRRSVATGLTAELAELDPTALAKLMMEAGNEEVLRRARERRNEEPSDE